MSARFAIPDTTAAGRAIFECDVAALGHVYRAAHSVVSSSSNPVAVRRAAICQALIAKRLGLGPGTVRAHLVASRRGPRFCEECGADHGFELHAYNCSWCEDVDPADRAVDLYCDELGVA